MMSLSAYARHRKRHKLDGATLNAVQSAIKSGRLKSALTEDGKKIHAAKAADAEWAATTRADMVPQTGPTAPNNGKHEPPVNELAAARLRREAAAADLSEMELAERRGELVAARDIEAKLSDVFLGCRTRLLAVVSRLREQDPTVTAQQLALVDALIREALEELAGPGDI